MTSTIFCHISTLLSGNFTTNVGYNFSRWADIKSAPNVSVFTRFKLSHSDSFIEFWQSSRKMWVLSPGATSIGENGNDAEGCLNAVQSVLWTQQLHYNTTSGAIHPPQSDKGIFWSIMLESRSHMSPNVCRTKTVLFLNRKYLLYNGEYMKHCLLCRSLLW